MLNRERMVVNSYSLRESDVELIRDAAQQWETTESAALRRIIREWLEQAAKVDRRDDGRTVAVEALV